MVKLVLLRAHRCAPIHSAQRHTREPVGPAEPEAECIQRQGVDDVHKQMDHALYGDHQEPELQHKWHSGPLSWDCGQSHAGIPINRAA